jgi:hypothetical protein
MAPVPSDLAKSPRAVQNDRERTLHPVGWYQEQELLAGARLTLGTPDQRRLAWEDLSTCALIRELLSADS